MAWNKIGGTTLLQTSKNSFGTPQLALKFLSRTSFKVFQFIIITARWWSSSSITDIRKATLSSQYSSVEATTVILGGKGFSPFVFYFNGKTRVKEANGEAEKPWTRVVLFSYILKTKLQLWRLWRRVGLSHKLNVPTEGPQRSLPRKQSTGEFCLTLERPIWIPRIRYLSAATTNSVLKNELYDRLDPEFSWLMEVRSLWGLGSSHETRLGHIVN